MLLRAHRAPPSGRRRRHRDRSRSTRGPGSPTSRSRSRTAISTAGTLGHGLGAIERQSDFFEIYTHTSGTVIVARVVARSARRPDASGPRYEVGAVHVSQAGEESAATTGTGALRDDGWRSSSPTAWATACPRTTRAPRPSAVFAARSRARRHGSSRTCHAALRADARGRRGRSCVDLDAASARTAGLGNIAAS